MALSNRRQALPRSSKDKTYDARRRSFRDLVQTKALQILVACLLLFQLGRSTYFIVPSYQSRTERDFRPYRFPSVQERVELYMGDWFAESCGGEKVVHRQLEAGSDIVYVTEMAMNDTHQPRVFGVRPHVEVSTIFYYNPESLAECSHRKWPIGPYCSESLATIREAKTTISWNEHIPILMQFGDEDYARAYSANGHELLYDPIVPHVKKFRASRPKRDQTLDVVAQARPAKCHDLRQSKHNIQPIIWKLNAKRHYRDLYLVPRNDRHWKDKRNMAIFRGAATGKGLQNHTIDCFELPRCQLAYQYASSSLIDAKLTKLLNHLPPHVNGVNLVGPELPLYEMLRYKGIIILEGNDVSSGLKWALLSQSVVLMPPPKFTSWAMEELLEPWVHYIPFSSDLSNVEEMIQWMLQHQAESQRISHRATLWIKDLVFHPDSESDDRQIYQEILKRYAAHFKL
ncbi:hypothetical protein MPSEU_000832200 [Mayamaea pseudoterrestris]|nr:hypothetical protein MPSEU_000832200 [Mayamaea pseudoterrestris]